MVINSVVTGSWFARTKLHLKEYYAFMQSGTSHLPIDPKTLRAAHKKLGLDSVKYDGGTFDFVTARFSDITATYFEDGLMLVTKPVSDLEMDAADLREFYYKRLSPALIHLYSMGTPTLIPSIEHQTKRPLFIVVDAATDEEAAELAARFNEKIHHSARYRDLAVHYCDGLNIIAVGNSPEALKDKILTTLMLSREYEHKLRHFLDAHRHTWEELEKMSAERKLAPSALPDIRSRLLSHQRESLVLRGRLHQMAEYLPIRQKEIDDGGLTEPLSALKIYRFDKLRSATNYIDQLWTMLLDYLASTTDITGFIYQENLQKEIEIQQYIFMLSAIASIIVLGTVSGASILLYDVNGQLLARGGLAAFTFYDLVRFGGSALLVVAIFFLLIKPLYRKIKMTSILGSMTKPDQAPRD